MKLFLTILFMASTACGETFNHTLKEDSTINVKVPPPVTCPTPPPCPTCPAPIVCPTPPPSEWTKCSNEYEECKFEGTKLVRYGVEGKWIAKIVTGPVKCGNAEFTDPAVTITKRCEVSSVPVAQPVSTTVPTPLPTATPKIFTTTQTFTKENEVISGIKVSSAEGHCVILKAKGIVLKDSEIGPCGKQGVSIQANDVTLENNYIHDAPNDGVYNYNSTNLKLIKNRIETVSMGANFVQSKNVVVEKNNFKNMTGLNSMGDFVQFNSVSGGKIRCNVGVNEEGKSKAEDNISIYASNGTATDPILVEYNKIKGGGPSGSSGGLMAGDGGGSYITVKGNILVNPGQYGLAVAGGNNITFESNRVYAEQKPWNNVGSYVWAQGTGMTCSNIKMINNKIKYTNKDGGINYRWDAKNCTNATDWTGTVLDQTLTAAIFDEEIAACK